MKIVPDLEADIAAGADELSRTGFCIIPNALPAQTIGDLDADGFYALLTERIARL